MIPEVKAYLGTKTSPNKTRFEVEDMLEKNFGITLTAWKRENPENTYFAFQHRSDGIEEPLTYKVQIPFIEKNERAVKNNRYSDIIAVYDEPSYYRFFYHILKSMMLNAQIGMTFEETFSIYLVVGALPEGTPKNVQEALLEKIALGKTTALALKGYTTQMADSI